MSNKKLFSEQKELGMGIKTNETSFMSPLNSSQEFHSRTKISSRGSKYGDRKPSRLSEGHIKSVITPSKRPSHFTKEEQQNATEAQRLADKAQELFAKVRDDLEG